jgi:hypothetical protein
MFKILKEERYNSTGHARSTIGKETKSAFHLMGGEGGFRYGL